MNLVSYAIYTFRGGLATVLRRLPGHGQGLTDVCSACPRGLSIYFNNNTERANGQAYRRCMDPVSDETSCKYRWGGARVDEKTGEKKRDCKK